MNTFSTPLHNMLMLLIGSYRDSHTVRVDISIAYCQCIHMIKNILKSDGLVGLGPYSDFTVIWGKLTDCL